MELNTINQNRAEFVPLKLRAEGNVLECFFLLTY